MKPTLNLLILSLTFVCFAMGFLPELSQMNYLRLFENPDNLREKCGIRHDTA